MKVCMCGLLEKDHYLGINCNNAREVFTYDNNGVHGSYRYICDNEQDCDYQRITTKFNSAGKKRA